MAALPGISMGEFLSKYPHALRDWIEQDLGWSVNEIKNILIEDEADLIVKVYITNKADYKCKTAITEFTRNLDDTEWKRKK